MNDLIKRLRDRACFAVDYEAADKIEKLEAALREIVHTHGDTSQAGIMARKALEQ